MIYFKTCDMPFHDSKTDGLHAWLARQDGLAPHLPHAGLARARDSAHVIREEAEYGRASSHPGPIAVLDKSGEWRHYGKMNTTLWRRFAAIISRRR